MKIWNCTRVNSLFILKKIKMVTSQARFTWTDGKPINLIKYLQELESSYLTFSFLNIDSFRRIWSNNSDTTLTCWGITNFNFSLTAAIFDLICYRHASGLAFLLSLNILFTRDYYISTRVEIFSTRDENLLIISP